MALRTSHSPYNLAPQKWRKRGTLIAWNRIVIPGPSAVALNPWRNRFRMDVFTPEFRKSRTYLLIFRSLTRHRIAGQYRVMEHDKLRRRRQRVKHFQSPARCVSNRSPGQKECRHSPAADLAPWFLGFCLVRFVLLRDRFRSCE
jgi:hypothetical protein